MENASKALLMAGGILLAVLVLGLLGLLLSSITSKKLSEEKSLEAQQLQEFNQQWEAYNKKALYGTDIITVVNKAIENNKKVEVSGDEDPYFINIVLNLENTYNSTTTTINKITGESVTEENENKSISGTIQLGEWQGNALTMDVDVTDIFGESITIKKETEKSIEYTYSPLANLKKAVFKCADVKYKNGRVKELVFKEKE